MGKLLSLMSNSKILMTNQIQIPKLKIIILTVVVIFSTGVFYFFSISSHQTQIQPAQAQSPNIWFFYNNENGIVGSAIPNSSSGPYWEEYNPPGVYRSDSIIGKYVELTTTNLQNAYTIAVQNRNAVYGTRWGETYPLTLIQGTTYYIAGRFRFDRINGSNIWQDSTAEMADQQASFDKLFEFQGSNFRWGIDSGYSDVACWYCRQPGDRCLNKFTFTAWVGKNSGVPCYENYAILDQNVPPYSTPYSAPYFCNYEKWYNVVLAVTAANSTSGRVQLWINGTKVTDQQNVHTMCSTTGSTVKMIYLNGTIAQPAYDAPAHKRSFDDLIFTDSWQNIIDGKYLTDPYADQPPTPSYLLPDLVKDRIINQLDFDLFKTRWALNTADFNSDSKTDSQDFGIMMSRWGSY